MLVIKIRKKQNRARKAFKKVILTSVGLFLAIGMFAAVDDDGFLFMLQHNTTVGSYILRIMQSVTTTVTGNKKQSTVGQQGVDYLLVQQMNEGYAKDYLKICLENQDGKLDTTKRKAYVPADVIIGINISETGLYNSAGGGHTLPRSDIGEKYIENGEYGKGNISLYKWSSREHATYTSATGIGGAFAYTPSSGAWTAINTKSIYNQGTSTPLGKGDGYLMPDAVSGLNGFLASGMSANGISANALKSSKYKSGVIAALTTVTHNTGSAFPKSLYGCPAFLPRGSQSPLRSAKGNPAENVERLEVLAQDMNKGISEMSDKNFEKLIANVDSQKLELAGGICLISQGWSISSEVVTRYMTYASRVIDVWNLFFPGNKVNNATQLREELNKHVTTLSLITGYSTDECDRIYGTIGGTYTRPIQSLLGASSSQAKAGVFFKILDGTTDALKGSKEAKRVIALGGLQVKPFFGAIAFGDRIARKMMIYAGVDKDLVNNSSGLTTSGGTTQGTGNGPEFTMENKYWNVLQKNGCDKSMLCAGRYKVLEAGLKIIMHNPAPHYNQGGDRCGIPKCKRVNHHDYDCSSFVSHAVQIAGFPSGIPQNTSSYPSGSSSVFSCHNSINYDVLLPGDILHKYGGHVEIYVGTRSGRRYTMGAHGRERRVYNTDWQKNAQVSITEYNVKSFQRIFRLKGFYYKDTF